MDFDAYAQETDLSPSGEGRSPVATATSTWRWLVHQGGQPEDRPWLSPEREEELLKRHRPGRR
jgi:hypothetical protein